MNAQSKPNLGERSGGLLLHPTSLAGPHGSGDLGSYAFEFLDFLNEAGQAWWQMLPVGPPGYGNCPYMASSAFALDPHLIDLTSLYERLGLRETDLALPSTKTPGRIRYEEMAAYRDARLRKASTTFFAEAGPEEISAYESFRSAEGGWLLDFALFCALKEKTGGVSWTEWDPPLRRRDSNALARAHEELEPLVRHYAFLQYETSRQWSALRERAAEKRVGLIGDIPIFVAHESVDVWANTEVFHLDEGGQPTMVAGVPPDYFSATGQRWGHPLYRWDALRDRGYGWWIARFRRTLALFDAARIDHFIGFSRYWEIPASSETAVEGRWMPGPGEDFFYRLQAELGNVPVIAEDLGTVTDEVIALREKFQFPGMRVLQFGFAGDPRTNTHLPHLHTRSNVAYTGTHDNDTTVGWFKKLRQDADASSGRAGARTSAGTGTSAGARANAGTDTSVGTGSSAAAGSSAAVSTSAVAGASGSASAATREYEFVLRYLESHGHEIHWDMIRLAESSVADIAMIPVQDLLGIGSEGRMNYPSNSTGNWEWRMRENALTPAMAARLRDLTETYGRLLPRSVPEKESEGEIQPSR